MKKPSSYLRFLPLCLALLLPWQVSHSALLFYDGFDYNLGNLNGNDGGTGNWAAWSGNNNVQVVAPGSTTTVGTAEVTAPDPMSYSGGTVAVDGGNRMVAGHGPSTRIFDTGAALTGQDIWMSFLFAGQPNGQVYVGLYSSTQTGNWLNYGIRFDAAGVKPSAGNSHGSAESITLATPKLLVFRVIWDAAAASGNGAYSGTQMFVNPTSLTTAPATPDRSVNNGAADLSPWQSFDRFHWGAQTANQQMVMDELRIGTTYDSVVIPEPATVGAFLGAAVLGLALWRRKRSARVDR